jgi:hypothetical protein
MRPSPALLVLLFACAPEPREPTVAELEQLCVDTSACLIDTCSLERAVVDDLREDKPASYDECLNGCSTSECLNACDSLPEYQAWREDIDFAVLLLDSCRAECSAPFDIPPDLLLECGSPADPEASERCAVESALYFFREELDHISGCSDWASSIVDG